MKRLLLPLGLWLGLVVLAVLGMAIANGQAGDANPDGEYGCCCPWSVHAGLCPSSLTDFLLAMPDVCMVLDDDGEVAGFCVDDPEGFYPFRDLGYPDMAGFLGQESVGTMIDDFCGFDHSHWLDD